MQENRRALARRQIRKDGKILFEDQPFFIECAIRNISDDGALLTMLVNYPLPRRILLWQDHVGVMYKCDVRWKRDLIVGVRFFDICGRAIRRALLEKCFAPLMCEPRSPHTPLH